MTPNYDEIMSWKPDALTFVANGLFALKASLDLEAPKAGNPVLNLTRTEWTGQARGPADDRAESITRWLRNMADEYGDLAHAVNTGAADIAGAITELRNATTVAGDEGYLLDRASHEYSVHFSSDRAPAGAEFNATTLAEVQGKLKSLGETVDRAVTETGSAVSSAVGELYALTPASLGVDSGLVSNQSEAFRTVYGRDPDSLNDWRIAAALDPHSYNPKNKGVPPVISVIKIKPVPGQGVVATGLFIPTERVIAGADLMGSELKRNLGDDRGFDSNFAPEDNRVSYFIDYESGVVVARQNPSVDERGHVKTGTPMVRACQLPDGTVAINYEGADPLALSGTDKAGWSVRGQTIVTPGPDGARVSGERTNFPSVETYQYMPDGRTRALLREDSGDHTEFGPMRDLPFQHSYGQYSTDLSRFPKDPDSVAYGPPPHPIEGMTEFGGVSNPPTIKGVG
ncbi:hypothetical protein GDN83_18545 [Gordonia jinghuaiqii]|uniref:Uncharacterized protein n=1 Tax=Gordonia jinghuaiqii TaxID=2758710 RepID=A0A7D7QNP4_9ACTN|nr:hypothetical protein [Gordonia jinghuaiqii]MCR5979713.1 hypothetical protein [Gordonia jinghuaiqii]QMT00886.1 hypothetical protein H1R19_18735 [Gordonia jinghuaiqii]